MCIKSCLDCGRCSDPDQFAPVSEYGLWHGVGNDYVQLRRFSKVDGLYEEAHGQEMDESPPFHEP